MDSIEQSSGGGGGMPGGSDTQVQFNDSGSFAGSSTFVFDKTEKVLTLTGSAVLAAGSAGTVPLSINIASSQSADAIQINSFGGGGGDRLRIDYVGRIRLFYWSDAIKLGNVVYGTQGSEDDAEIVANSLNLKTNSASWHRFDFVNNSTAAAGFISYFSGKPVISATCAHAGAIGEVILAASGQTANLKEYRDSSATLLSAVSAAGNPVLRSYSSGSMPGTAATGEMAYVTTTGKPAWYSGAAWKYADGSSV